MREILPGGIARTDQGDVRAGWVVRATEGYTASIRGRRRRLLPMNSLDDRDRAAVAEAMAAIGWDDAETIHDMANAYVYIQRTADDRIALGGRGVPYRYGSRTDRAGEIAPGTVASLERRLRQLFPQATEARVAHGWSGVLGVPRDWRFAVGADPERRVAWSGGYVGVGVAAANLGGRIVADLVRGEKSDLATLPFVGHAWRATGSRSRSLPRRDRHVLPVPHRRQARGPHRPPVPPGRDREHDHRPQALRYLSTCVTPGARFVSKRARIASCRAIRASSARKIVGV